MKKIITKAYKIIIFVALLFTAISCSKGWLDPKPLSFLTPENTLNTKVGIGSLLNQCSAGLRIEFNGRMPYILRDDVYSDIAVLVNGAPRNLVTQLLPSNATPVQNVWDYAYLNIQYANTVVASAKVLNETETVKNPLIAEGNFFQAYWYYKLVNVFGDVPLVLDAINSPKLDFKSATKRKILATMITNLEFAVQYLPETAPDGRINRAAGQHLLTKYYLQVGRFQDAVNMASNIINNTNYALMYNRFGIDAGDATKNIMWDLFHKYNPGLSGNTEKILIVQDYPGIPGGTPAGSERMRNFETQWFQNNFNSKGKIAVASGLSGEPQISNTGQGLGMIKQTEYFGYQLWNDKGDMRHKAPCWVPMTSLVYNKPGSVDYGKPLVKKQCQDTLKSWDDIYWNKIVVDDERLAKGLGLNIMGGCMDWYVYRLAETYLLRAEAYVWLGKSTEAGNDINKVRTRAGAAPIPLANVSLDDVLDERARELFLEEFRSVELKRISYTMALLKMNGYSMETLPQKNYYYDRMMQKNQFYRTNFLYNKLNYTIQPFNIYWPIPETAIQDNTLGQINQNYGYVGYENNIAPED